MLKTDPHLAPVDPDQPVTVRISPASISHLRELCAHLMLSESAVIETLLLANAAASAYPEKTEALRASSTETL